MIGDEVRVAFLHDGTVSDEQRAATAWLDDSAFGTRNVAFADLPGRTDEFDVLWWHRHAPIGAGTVPDRAVGAIEDALSEGAGLVLSLRAMAAVDRLGVDDVPPDAVGIDSVTEPTGVLWRTQYDDHPAVDGVDSLRVPVSDRGAVPFARYERILPAEGEILGATVRGDRDVPTQMTTVSWSHDGGTVLGVGAPIAFHEPAADGIAEARSALTAGILAAAADEGTAPTRPKSAEDFRELRTGSGADHTRPDYHFTPPANWLNDPNGLIEWNGRYHVFYQYNPAGPFHNTIHWGHAVSDDLLHWRDEPVALTPSPDGPDRDGCWSGCAVDDDGTPTVLYTGGDGHWQLPCLATADDPGLRRWTKDEENPVIEEPPADPDLLGTDDWAVEFRDHSVWREGDRWYQVIGSGLADGGGTALLYTSRDLREWEYEGPLLAEAGTSGTVWECPELLDLGDAHLLHVSDYENVVYFLGDLRDGEFEVDHRGLLDHGDFYAPQSLWDGDRHLTWGWLPETRDVSAQWNAGWSGALSLPRVVSVGPDGHLRQRPAEEVTQLRTDSVATPDVGTLRAGDRYALGETTRAMELELEVALVDASAFELSVFESADRSEGTPIRYTREGELIVDRTASSRRDVGSAEPQRMAVPPHDEPLSLRVFLDGSVIELYANERHCLTSRVYPDPESVGVSIAAEGGRADLSLSAWDLEAAVTAPGQRAPVDSRPSQD